MAEIGRLDIKVYTNQMRIASPIILTDQVVTNGAGVARLYLTLNGLAGGEPMFRNVYTWTTDVEALTPATTRTSSSGVNYIEATVTTLTFSGVILLGIPLLGSVTNTPATGVTVKFTVLGD